MAIYEDEPYEALTAAIAAVNLAQDLLAGIGRDGDYSGSLRDIRNAMNSDRVFLLECSGRAPTRVGDLLDGKGGV